MDCYGCDNRWDSVGKTVYNTHSAYLGKLYLVMQSSCAFLGGIRCLNR